MLDQALAQIPDAHRHGTDVLIRADSAGSAKVFLAHVRDLRKQGIRTFFSVGYAITEPVRRAVRAMPDRLWRPALDQDGTLRDGFEVAELTGLVDLTCYPASTRIIVRRERPHPGHQLSLFDQDEGLRHQVFLTDTHTPVADPPSSWRSATAGMPQSDTTSGAARPPASAASPPALQRQRVWLELSLTAIDLLALDARPASGRELATADPMKLRYRLLHVAARLTRDGRRLRLRISASWPWRNELATAFHRLAALPRPVG